MVGAGTGRGAKACKGMGVSEDKEVSDGNDGCCVGRRPLRLGISPAMGSSSSVVTSS